MRFYEFAATARPVLKISQQAKGNTPATPLPVNTQPTPVSAEPIKVYPRKWQHEWLQKYLAAEIARSAQTIKPTNHDLTRAFMRYGQAQSAGVLFRARSVASTNARLGQFPHADA